MVPWSFELGSWQCGAPHPEVAATPQEVLLRLPLPQVLLQQSVWQLGAERVGPAHQLRSTPLF